MKCLAGKVYDGEGFRDGYALVEGGKTVEIGEGKIGRASCRERV